MNDHEKELLTALSQALLGTEQQKREAQAVLTKWQLREGGEGETGIHCEGWEGPCKSTNAKRRAQNTRYVDENRNWVTLCDDCMKLNHEHWRGMWSDFYANCM